MASSPSNDEGYGITGDGSPAAVQNAEDVVSDGGSTAVGANDVPSAPAPAPTAGVPPPPACDMSQSGLCAVPGLHHIPIPAYVRYGSDTLIPDFSVHARDVWWGGAAYRAWPGTVVLESNRGPTACVIIPATSAVPFRSSLTGGNMGFVHTLTPGNDANLAGVHSMQPWYCFSVEFIGSALDGFASRVLYETVISAPPLVPPPVAVVP